MSNLLTHSRLRTLRSCARRHEYEYELAVRPQQPAKALRMGAAFHRAIELVEREGKSHGDAITEGTADYRIMPAWADDPVSRTEWLLEAETVRRMLAGYFWRWSRSRLEVVASELEVHLPIINPDTGRHARGYTAAIKIDSIVRLEDRRLAVRETKTAGESIEPKSDYWRRLRIDPQISLAVFAARHAGHDVRTVLYDAMRKPAIRPRKLTKIEQRGLMLSGKWHAEDAPLDALAETVPMWGARLRRDMADRPGWYFARVEIARLDDELEEFRRDLWDLMQALRGYRKRNHWPRNVDARMNYGRCPYFDLCSSGRHLTADDELPAGMMKLENVHPELTLEGVAL